MDKTHILLGFLQQIEAFEQFDLVVVAMLAEYELSLAENHRMHALQAEPDMDNHGAKKVVLLY